MPTAAAAIAPALLGPPELYTPKNTTTTTDTTTEHTPPTTTKLGIQQEEEEEEEEEEYITMIGLTENNSPTFLTTGHPCLDFFFHVVPNTPRDTLIQRLELSWAHDPLTTLKLVCNLRGVRGTGKSDREGFYTAVLWLHAHHPKTLRSNLPSLADFGCFKDLPEILYRLLEGSDIRKILKTEWNTRKRARHYKVLQLRRHHRLFRRRRFQSRTVTLKNFMPKKTLLNANERGKAEKESAHLKKEEKRIAMAKKLIDRYKNDANFRLLHDSVSEHFAECLKKDLQFLRSEHANKISLAAKWCPSVDSSFDRSTLLCETIAKRVFPREEYEGVEEAHYAYRVRDRLRKEVLVPLRKVLALPEVYIGANRWDLIHYNRVASVAMKFYKEKFLKHDKERFQAYLSDVKSGKSTIAAGALLPHEIIGSLYDEDGGYVAELQWKRMVDDMTKKGNLKDCLAVCDVSGSMYGTPMNVCVALGLLVSELNEEPWKGKVVTFSQSPELHLIEGDDLKSKKESVEEMDWGMNTNFQKVFDLMLEVAVSGNLEPDQMIKRLFVFSDMEFDEASANPWETDYQAIVRKFNEKGYGSAVPQIVFWNLRSSMSTPVEATQKGVAMLSGFSKNLLTLFINKDGDISPLNAMELAISGPEYRKLVVLD